MSERHRIWVNSLPPLRLADGTEFDKTQVVPYAYRHTYAQRHADAGVHVDVLRELMDDRLLDTTKRYYSVGEVRRREAVDRVATLQFDRLLAGVPDHSDRASRVGGRPNIVNRLGSWNTVLRLMAESVMVNTWRVCPW